MKLSRRDWMWLAAGLATPKLWSRQAKTGRPEGLFIEVPASTSGIDFVHENAMSPNRYLPETMGPGAAFFDFDNDGWMDLYIVNSGPCDFWTPTRPIRNADDELDSGARRCGREVAARRSPVLVAGTAHRPFWRKRIRRRSSMVSIITISRSSAREHAKKAGVADRITFEVAPAKSFPGKHYDFVAFFDGRSGGCGQAHGI